MQRPECQVQLCCVCTCVGCVFYETAMGSRVQALSCILWTSLLISFTDALKVNAGLSSGNATGTDEDARHHKRNNRVLIGLLSQPSDPSGRHESYIAASYVKFLESAGARVVPFVHDMDKDEIKRRCRPYFRGPRTCVFLYASNFPNFAGCTSSCALLSEMQKTPANSLAVMPQWQLHRSTDIT